MTAITGLADMTADKSTKRPWAVNWAGLSYWIEVAGSGDQIAELDIQYRNDGEVDLEAVKANASLIVTAVNERDALLKCTGVLKDCTLALAVLRNMCAKAKLYMGADTATDMLKRADEALAALEKANLCKPDSTLTDPDNPTALPRREGE